MLYSSQDAKGNLEFNLAASSPHPLLGNLLFWRVQNAIAAPITAQTPQRDTQADHLN